MAKPPFLPSGRRLFPLLAADRGKTLRPIGESIAFGAAPVVVASSTHAHTASSPTLATNSPLTVNSATHEHIASVAPMPAVKFNFRVATLDSRLTPIGGANGTTIGSTGLVEAASCPRWYYNPDTLELEGILFEDSRTNLALWSRDLTNAVWTKTNCTAAQTATGADGVANSATTLTATAANATVLQSITDADFRRVSSLHIKRISGSGTVEITQDGGTTWTAITLTSGWTRVNGPTELSIVNPVVGLRIGTSGDSIAVDYFQHERTTYSSGGFGAATTPIVTTTAPVTRTVDYLLCDGTNYTSWHNASEGTYVAEARTLYGGLEGGIILSDGNGSADNGHLVRLGTWSSTTWAMFSNSGTGNALLIDGATSISSFNKIGMAYKADDFAGAVNGAVAQTDNSCTLGTTNGLRIGNTGGGYGLNGIVRSVTYFATRVLNTYLSELTAPIPQIITGSCSHGHSATSPSLVFNPNISANNAAHSHSATSPTVAANSSIIPANSAQAHAATSPTLATNNAVTPASTVQAHVATSPTLGAVSAIVPANTSQAHAATSPSLAALSSIVPANSVQAHITTQPTVATNNLVVPADSLHALTSTQPSIAAVSSLTPASATHSLTSTSPTLATANVITVNSSTQGHVCTSPTIGAVSFITPANGVHALTSDQASVTATFVIAIGNGIHSLTSTQPAVSTNNLVVPADAAHAHIASSPTIAARSVVSVNSSSHAHSATIPSVATANVITPANAQHGLSSTSPAIGAVSFITPADNAIAHQATSASIAALSAIIPASCVQAHLATQASVSARSAIVPADTLHSHTASNVTIAHRYDVAVQNCVHAHTASLVDITPGVIVHDSLHSHISDQAAIAFRWVLAPHSAFHAHAASQAAVSFYSPYGIFDTPIPYVPPLTTDLGAVATDAHEAPYFAIAPGTVDSLHTARRGVPYIELEGTDIPFA